MIQRYTARDDYENHGPYEDDGGEWVKFSDLDLFISAVLKYASMSTATSPDKLFNICIELAGLTRPDKVYYAEGLEDDDV